MKYADLIREAREYARCCEDQESADLLNGLAELAETVEMLGIKLKLLRAENERLRAEVVDARRLLEVGFSLPPGMLRQE